MNAALRRWHPHFQICGRMASRRCYTYKSYSAHFQAESSTKSRENLWHPANGSCNNTWRTGCGRSIFSLQQGYIGFREDQSRAAFKSAERKGGICKNAEKYLHWPAHSLQPLWTGHVQLEALHAQSALPLAPTQIQVVKKLRNQKSCGPNWNRSCWWLRFESMSTCVCQLIAGSSTSLEYTRWKWVKDYETYDTGKLLDFEWSPLWQIILSQLLAYHLEVYKRSSLHSFSRIRTKITLTAYLQDPAFESSIAPTDLKHEWRKLWMIDLAGAAGATLSHLAWFLCF